MKSKQPCQYLPWDTDFFGFRIARVTENRLSKTLASDISSWCINNKIDCLYLLADSDHAETIRIAEDNNFRLVDMRLTLELNLNQWHFSDPPSNIIVRPWESMDLVDLQRIARENFPMTRFYYDPCFPKELCSALYETWIVKSCQGYADLVRVATMSDNVAGFITGHLDRDTSEGKVGLIGIDHEYQKKGVGRALLNNILEWFSEQDISQVSVVTQGRNVSAQRLYQRSNFMTKTVQLWYHKWFSPRESDPNPNC